MDHTQHDIKGLVGAVQTREALEEVEMRHMHGSDYRPGSSPQGSSLHAPVYNEKGELFAGRFIKKHFAFSLPEDTKPNTLLEYKTSGDKYHYGVVIKSDNPTQRIKVRELTAEDVVDFKEEFPDAPMVNLSEKDMEAMESSVDKLRKLLNFLDPSEFFLFKFFSFMLMKGVFEQDSVADIFISVYLRVLALTILLIVTFYTSTFFFS